MILREDQIHEELEQLKHDYDLYLNITEENIAYYEGFNSLIDDVDDNEKYSIECSNYYDEIESILSEYRENVNRLDYKNANDYETARGRQDALVEVLAMLGEFYD